MKKIVSIIFVMLIATMMVSSTLVVTLADEEVIVVTPTTNSDNTSEIVIKEEGNYIIKEDCVINKMYLDSCTLSITGGVTVTINGNCDISPSGTLIIEKGSQLVINEDKINYNQFTNTSGKVIVYGTLTSYAKSNTNNGIINVHGTFEIKNTLLNVNTINIYSDGQFIDNNESLKFIGIFITGLECNEKHPCIVHAFSEGKCVNCEYECAHENIVDGICADCQMVIENNTASILSNGNLWIIVSVIIVAIASVSTIVIVKKKK